LGIVNYTQNAGMSETDRPQDFSEVCVTAEAPVNRSVAATVAVRRRPTPVLREEEGEVLCGRTEIVGIQRAQHDVVCDPLIEAVDESDEERHPADGLVHRDVVFHGIDTRVAPCKRETRLQTSSYPTKRGRLGS